MPMPKYLWTPEEKEIKRLRAQVASLVKDIKAAEALLTAGDDNGALEQVRLAASRASQSYLDCIGRDAVKPNARVQPGEASAATRGSGSLEDT